MPLSPHTDLLIQDNFSGTITGMNGRTPSPTTRGSNWVDATTSSKWITGSVAGTVRAGVANAGVSIDTGASTHTVEAALDLNSLGTGITNRTGLGLGGTASFTSVGTTPSLYRVYIDPTAGTIKLYNPSDNVLATSTNITAVNPGSKVLRATLRFSTHNQISAWYDGTAVTWDHNQPSGSSGDTYTDTADLLTAGNFAGLLARSTVPLFSLFKVYGTVVGGLGGARTSVIVAEG